MSTLYHIIDGIDFFLHCNIFLYGYFTPSNELNGVFFHYVPFNFTELRFYLQYSETKHVYLCICNITYGWVCMCATYLCDHVMWYEKSNTFARFVRNGKFFELSVTFVFDIHFDAFDGTYAFKIFSTTHILLSGGIVYVTLMLYIL